MAFIGFRLCRCSGIRRRSEPRAQDENTLGDLESVFIPYIYEGENRKNPFQPYQEEKKLEVSTSFDEAIGPMLPLQRFSLDELKLVGIIWDVEEPRAMFVDPENKVHVVGKDERIGQKNGYIATIREGEVVVVQSEKVRGEFTFSTKVIKIKK